MSDGLLNDADTVKITVTAGGGGGSTFNDTFTRADSDLLGPGGSGPQWAEPPVSGLYTGNLVIGGGQLRNAARGDNIGYLPALTGANQSASGDFISSDNNASPRLGVLLRFQDFRNHYRLYRISGGTSQLRISKLINGAETILKSVQVPMAPVGTPFHLVGSVVGQTLTLTMGSTTISCQRHDVRDRDHRRAREHGAQPPLTRRITSAPASARRRAPDDRRPDRAISRTTRSMRRRRSLPSVTIGLLAAWGLLLAASGLVAFGQPMVVGVH